MKRLRLWLAICVMLLFAAGGAVGFLAARAIDRHPKGAIAFPQTVQPWSHKLISSEEVWRELELNAQQKENIQALLTEHYEEVRALEGRMLAESQEVRAAVLPLLSPQQRAKLKKIEQRYEERKTDSEVIRQLALIRREVVLQPEQEASVYKILYDAAREKREYFQEACRKEGRKPGRDEVRHRFKEMHDRVEERLARVLSDEQMEKYESLARERRRWWRDKKRHKTQKDECDGPRQQRDGERSRNAS